MDSVTVVTGAARGIGRALADRFAKDGSAVVLADINADELERSATAISKVARAPIVAITTDVRDANQVERLAAETFDRFGQVDVLCNNTGGGAGFTASSALWETPLSHWREVLELNLFGALNVIRSFVPRLIAQSRESHIVNTAAMTGLVPNFQVTPYAAAKHSLVTMTESLAHQLAGVHPPVRVSVLLPGPTDTEAMRAARTPTSSSDAVSPVQQNRVPVVAPETLADLVASAVRTDRFWLFSNPGSAQRIRVRIEPMLEAADMLGSV